MESTEGSWMLRGKIIDGLLKQSNDVTPRKSKIVKFCPVTQFSPSDPVTQQAKWRKLAINSDKTSQMYPNSVIKRQPSQLKDSGEWKISKNHARRFCIYENDNYLGYIKPTNAKHGILSSRPPRLHTHCLNPMSYKPMNDRTPARWERDFDIVIPPLMSWTTRIKEKVCMEGIEISGVTEGSWMLRRKRIQGLLKQSKNETLRKSQIAGSQPSDPIYAQWPSDSIYAQWLNFCPVTQFMPSDSTSNNAWN